jgi:hypothetical protein
MGTVADGKTIGTPHAEAEAVKDFHRLGQKIDLRRVAGAKHHPVFPGADGFFSRLDIEARSAE